MASHVLVAALEMALRVFDSGSSTRPFLACEIDGEDHLRLNPAYCAQFFLVPASMIVDWDTFQFLVPARKSPQDYRIFGFGGSAAHGDPDPARSFGECLGAMLQRAFPQMHIEV
ncbi:MAG TPA: hypothetical protein PK468_23390 [Candidatus Hydrogenedentes bacterium]|nr:hypothetical protein [Candidatus Hydrogenedentota bacterium]